MKQPIDQLAQKHGYKCIKWQEDICMVSYKKDDARINVYITTMTVATCIDHPKKGKTQLFRKNVSMQMLEQIFINPRQHTGKGYYTK